MIYLSNKAVAHVIFEQEAPKFIAKAGNSAVLTADNQVNLVAATNQASNLSTNSASSSSIGASYSVTTGAVGFNASASKGQGNSNGADTSWANTHITAGNTAAIQSGGDTHIKGAVVAANTIKANVGTSGRGNFNIESLQDTSSYASGQSSASGSISVGGGTVTGASISASKSNIASTFTSVNQQSGLEAGDGGFQVSVANNTALTGAVISSTDTAVNTHKNSFATGGSLTTTDLQNTASYKGTAVGVSASMGASVDSKGHTNYLPGGSAGVGTDKGQASSTTTAGISGLSGNTAVRTGDAETGLKPIFDAQKVQKRIDAGVAVTASFGQQASKAIGDYAAAQMDEAAKLRIKAGGLNPNDPESTRLTNEANAIDANWGDKGILRLGAHTAVGGLTGGINGAAGAAAGTLAAPTVADALSSADVKGPLASTITALVSTAAGAVVGGTPGAAAGFNEVTNNYLTHPQALDKQTRLARAKTDEERKQINAEYDKLDTKQSAEAAACLLKDQCASVFDKPSLRATLAELNTACTPPRLCTLEEKTSIAQLQGFYTDRQAVKPDTTVEEILLGNKLIGTAFTVARGTVARLLGQTTGVEVSAGGKVAVESMPPVSTGANASGTAGTAGSSVNVGPWSKGITNVVENGTFTQCGNGSCVSATAQVLTNGTVTEAQVVARIGEWADPLKLPGVLNDLAPGSTPWRGGYFGSSADAVTIANKGPMGAVLQAPGEAAHMVTISPVPGSPGMFRVQDTGAGKTYDVSASWIGKYVVGGVWK